MKRKDRLTTERIEDAFVSDSSYNRNGKDSLQDDDRQNDIAGGEFALAGRAI